MRLSIFVTILTLVSHVVAAPAPEVQWCSMQEIERLALAAALADYPVLQGKIREEVGVPKVPPLWGSTHRTGGPFWIAALTEPKEGLGYYAVRIVYRDYEEPPAPEKIEVVAIEVLYVSPSRLTFVYEPTEGIRKMLPQLKADMKKARLTPKDFSARFFGAADEKEINKEPNQPPEPTAPSGRGSP